MCWNVAVGVSRYNPKGTNYTALGGGSGVGVNDKGWTQIAFTRICTLHRSRWSLPGWTPLMGIGGSVNRAALSLLTRQTPSRYVENLYSCLTKTFNLTSPVDELVRDSPASFIYHFGENSQLHHISPLSVASTWVRQSEQKRFISNIKLPLLERALH